MFFRPIQAEDFDSVLEMMRVFYASEALLIHPEDGVLRRTLTDVIGPDPFVEGFVMEYAGALAGYGLLAKSYSTEAGGHCIWIEDVYVLPEFRGKGLASAFIKFVKGRFPEAARIRLEAEPENERAMSVYHGAGFSELGYTQLIIDR